MIIGNEYLDTDSGDKADTETQLESGSTNIDTEESISRNPTTKEHGKEEPDTSVNTDLIDESIVSKNDTSPSKLSILGLRVVIVYTTL